MYILNLRCILSHHAKVSFKVVATLFEILSAYCGFNPDSISVISPVTVCNHLSDRTWYLSCSYLPFMPSFCFFLCAITQVPKDNPVLRVLFHTTNYHNIGHNAQICIVLTASMEANNGNGRNKKNIKTALLKVISHKICHF